MDKGIYRYKDGYITVTVSVVTIVLLLYCFDLYRTTLVQKTSHSITSAFL